MSETTTAIVKRETSGALAPFEPANLGEALKMAEMLSKSGIIPKAYRGKPSDILVNLMAGREMRLSPIQSLRGIDVIEGNIFMRADLIVAKARQHPDCLYFRLVESTDEKATYETQRKNDPEPTRLTYTIKDAQRAKLADKDNWKKNTPDMLRARASSKLARAMYQDALFGVYEYSEREEVVGNMGNIQAAGATQTKADELRQRIAAQSESVNEQTGEVIDAEVTETTEEPETPDAEPEETEGELTAGDLPFAPKK